MVAADRCREYPAIGKVTAFVGVHTSGTRAGSLNIELVFAGNLTCSTSDAALLIMIKAQSHRRFSLVLFEIDMGDEAIAIAGHGSPLVFLEIAQRGVVA